jgi:hypothetical protein
MIKRTLNGVLTMAADVIDFPSPEELEERKRIATDPERVRARRKQAERRREDKLRKEKNKRITESLKKDDK